MNKSQKNKLEKNFIENGKRTLATGRTSAQAFFAEKASRVCVV